MSDTNHEDRLNLNLEDFAVTPVDIRSGFHRPWTYAIKMIPNFWRK